MVVVVAVVVVVVVSKRHSKGQSSKLLLTKDIEETVAVSAEFKSRTQLQNVIVKMLEFRVRLNDDEAFLDVYFMQKLLQWLCGKAKTAVVLRNPISCCLSN